MNHDGEHDEDLKLGRSEEEVRTGTRVRDAGALNVRKNVRTEREEVRVPRRREELHIERTPHDTEVPEAEITDDGEEVVIRVYEEEVVVTKRVVLKEEIRIRKKIVEEVEVVEVDLRKEEVELDDRTEHGAKTTDGRADS